MENAPLQDLGKMAKQNRRISDVVTDVSLNITAIIWKDKKNCNCSVYIHWKGTNPVCKNVLQETESINIYNKSMR